MACAITSGYTLDCKDSTGGLVEVYFINKGDVSTMTEASGVITALTKATGKQFYKYELPKQTSSLTETITGSIENGTVFYAQELVIIVNKLTVAVRNQIKLLAQATLLAVGKDQNGRYWLIGYQNGIDLTTGTSGTGTAYGDRSGYSLTFTGAEPQPMFEVEASVAAALETQG